jgi:aminopeptidase N
MGFADLAAAQSASPTPSPAATPQRSRGHGEPTRFDILRGAYGPYRANNDLLFYHLDIRIDPEKKFISGKNTIRFKMLKDDTRIQLDLIDTLNIDKILMGEVALKYERDTGAVFVNFPETLHAGRVYSIDFYYSGAPVQTGRF